MNHARQLVFKRAVTVATPPTAHPPNVVSAASVAVKDSTALASKTTDTAEIAALGNPPTVLNIHSPPSVPVYVRRGALLSIYGTSEAAIAPVRSSLALISPFSRFFYGNFVSSYQRLVSTVPFSILVLSASRNFSVFGSPNKAFVNLSLDGSADWAILDKDAVHAYTGNSLAVSMYRTPATISRKLAKTLAVSSRTQTGLSRWNHLGFSLLSGRGQAGLVGNGSVYSITLKEEESVLVNRGNLLGVSVNGPYDLGNCCIKYEFEKGADPTEKTVVKTARTPSKSAYVNSAYQVWDGFRSALAVVGRYTGIAWLKSLSIFSGNHHFLKVVGPRSLLLQSNSPNQYAVNTFPSFPKVTGAKSADYLSYVTVSDQKTEFKSTPDFQDTVKKIERR